MVIVESSYTSLCAIGKDEYWVYEWILEKPARLGLGDIDVTHHTRIRPGCHEEHLDILAYRADRDTFYEIEIMLNSGDATHGLRTVDYYSRERLRHPESRHVAVLVAENLATRYRPLLDGLPQVLPFIGIEINVLALPLGDGMAAVLPSIIAHSHDVAVDERAGQAKRPRI
jgi:hypothetical protein